MDSSAEQQLQAAAQVVPPISPPSPQRRKPTFWFMVLLCLFILVIAVFISIAGASVYANTTFPFISVKQHQELAKILYKIPFLPKTAEQILLTASEENLKLTSYSPEFSLSATLGATGIGAGSLDLKVKGPIDLSPGKKISFDLTIDAGVNFAGKFYQGNGRIRKKDDTVYGKIDKVSDTVIDTYTSFSSSSPSSSGSAAEIRQNLEGVFPNWLSYDTRGVESEARKALEGRGNQQSLIDTTRRKTQEFLLQSTVLPEVKRLADETIEGTSTYHLQLIPSKPLLRKVLIEVMTQNTPLTNDIQKTIDSIGDSVESAQIDVWFGKKDALLRRLSLQTQVKLDILTNYFSAPLAGLPSSPFSSLGSFTAPKLSVSTVLTIRDIGKAVGVDIPTPLKTLEQYLELLSQATKTKEQVEQTQKQTQYDNDFRALQSALLKHYVAGGEYPADLTTLTGKEIPATDPLTQRLANYSYRLSADKKNFLIYVVFSLPYRHADVTPFYGITSLNAYPHQLTKRDFDFSY